MTTLLELAVTGEPIPQGSKSVSRAGRLYDANPRLKAWRKHMTECFAYEWGDKDPLDKPLAIEIRFYLPRPVSAKNDYADKKPDIDKLTRAAFDSLEAAGVIRNDSRFVDLVAIKRRPDGTPPFMYVKIKDPDTEAGGTKAGAELYAEMKKRGKLI